MKQKILFLLSFCMVLLFSCSDSDDPIKEIEKPLITLDESNVNFTNEGSEKSISFETNMDWSATSSQDWCKVSPTSGTKGSKSIAITTSANKEYDSRSCTVTIKGGDVTKTITVSQGENLGLLVSQDKYELSNGETTIEVEVKANVEFEVVIPEEFQGWITQTETRGLVDTKLLFLIAQNEDYDSREGSITIKQTNGTMESTVTVFQSQTDAIIISDKVFDVSSEAQQIEVEVKTNVDYEVLIPEDAKEWVSIVETRALRTETLMLDVAENESYDERSTEVYVKNRETSLQDTLTINQTANRGLIVGTDKYELSNGETTIEVEMKANVAFDVVISDNWITQLETRGLTETKLQFLIAQNSTYDNREGSITINEQEGELSSTIAIFQSQENAIILSKKSVNLSSESQTINVGVITNVELEVIIPGDAKDWISYSPTRGLRTEYLLLNIAENKDSHPRSAEVYVKDKETALQDTLTIAQSAYSNLVVDDEGGIIAEDDVTIEVPQGAFTGEVTVEITQQPPNSVMDEYEASGYYELKIPKDFTKPLKVQLPANTEVEEDVYFCFAAPGYQKSGQKETITTHLVKATKVGGVYEAMLEPFDVDVDDDSNYDDENITIGLVKDYIEGEIVTRSADSNFKVFCPRFYESYMGFLTQSVSESINILDGIGYNFKKRDAPLRIVVKPFGNDDGFGYFEQSLYDSWSHIAINGKKLDQKEEMKRTIIHELTHFSQSYFDPRNQFSKSKFEGNFLWMSEAIAVWTESLYVDGISIVQQQNQIAPLVNGFYPPDGNSGVRQNHGYGMAGLIHWLAKNNGNSSIVTLDVAQMNGAKTTYDAFKTAFPSMFDSYRYVSFLHDYVRSGGVDGMLLIAAPKLHIMDMQEYQTAKPEKAERFSAFAQKIDFNPDIEFPETLEGLKIMVEGGRGDYCDLLKFSKSSKQFELIESFSDNYIYDDAKDIKAIHNNRESLYAIYYHPYSVKNKEPIVVKAKLAQKQPKITLTTSRGIGEKLSMTISAAKFEDIADIWIDLNNNGKLDEGEKLTRESLEATYTLQSKTFSIYGRIGSLRCSGANLTSLDASGSETLWTLICQNNQLTSLNVNGCTNLETFFCNDNRLTKLDVSSCTKLKMLGCSNNSELSSLNVNGCVLLEDLYCSNSNLTSLDVSGSVLLKDLSCENSNLTSLDVNGFTNLEKLKIENNQLTSVDVGGCSALRELSCINNQLTSLNVAGCTALEYLDCSGSSTANMFLTSLDVSGCTALISLDCKNNEIVSLDASGCTQLETIYCDNNQLTSISLNGCNALKTLLCHYNQLTSLDVSGLNSLASLLCSDNQLTSLNIDGCTALESLNCKENKLMGVRPAAFDDIKYIYYDIRYEYKWDRIKWKYVAIKDNNNGYWYDHEPEGGIHAPEPRN